MPEIPDRQIPSCSGPWHLPGASCSLPRAWHLMGTRRTSFSWWRPELEPVPENECCAQNGSDPWPKALFSSEASGPDSLPGPDTLIPQTRAPTNLLAGGSRAGRETACPISLRVIGLGQRSLCERGLHSEPHTPPSYCHLCMHCETRRASHVQHKVEEVKEHAPGLQPPSRAPHSVLSAQKTSPRTPQNLGEKHPWPLCPRPLPFLMPPSCSSQTCPPPFLSS